MELKTLLLGTSQRTHLPAAAAPSGSVQVRAVQSAEAFLRNSLSVSDVTIFFLIKPRAQNKLKSLFLTSLIMALAQK